MKRKVVATRGYLGRLVVSLLGLALCVGCTFHHAVAIRYTPMIQSPRLANVNSPEVMTLGEFEDARANKTLDRERINPISVHHIEYDTVGDVPTVVRSAFLDALLKSGFSVPMAGDPIVSEPVLRVSGKILTYATDMKSHWSTVEANGTVEVMVTLAHRNGKTETITVRGTNRAEGKGSMGTDSMVNTLDVALQECVKAFLADPRFVAMLKEQ
ncbi:MAG: hypothetical protein NDJ94_20740 [Vicinamibacteria bacterium]|nr:hypothetical protein [Vicinamibacteria bacterium]